ncbi:MULTISPECIES: hypothetical protein [Polaromonas]|uniref:Uncharacterized protein n=1 Tax=Polaromonas naphthalenivorans (strain CJ2) TaxID=365044 RepID=A1VVL2_POLNA|nr:hypothetical protein [Polaromonas naphthalenivorans]ABM39690.1 conserved hypothetical protein [Polaromonas naphthalenivorans CJ2]
MGQAKLRGTFEQRAANAKTNARAQFPDSIQCNNCQAWLTEIEPLDIRGIPGMRLAGGAVCAGCAHTTWVLDGTPEALAGMQGYLDDAQDEEAKIGFVKKPQA